ncbi:MAG: hypothetical protein ACAI43_14550 [Phycisphaerae bacterium]|nr:hypothetical protein [Tepidisphaeraceae bacterium]
MSATPAPIPSRAAGPSGQGAPRELWAVADGLRDGREFLRSIQAFFGIWNAQVARLSDGQFRRELEAIVAFMQARRAHVEGLAARGAEILSQAGMPASTLDELVGEPVRDLCNDFWGMMVMSPDEIVAWLRGPRSETVELPNE